MNPEDCLSGDIILQCQTCRQTYYGREYAEWGFAARWAMDIYGVCIICTAEKDEDAGA